MSIKISAPGPTVKIPVLEGSSMGALISIYSGFIYPEVYGKMMIFSPSLWLTPKIFFSAIKFINPFFTKIYLYAGGKESKTMIPNVKRLKSALQSKGLESSKIEFNDFHRPRRDTRGGTLGRRISAGCKVAVFSKFVNHSS